MSDNIEIRTMRCMAWERSKGELRSMLQTYWGESIKFEQLEEAINEFVDHVESNGFQE